MTALRRPVAEAVAGGAVRPGAELTGRGGSGRSSNWRDLGLVGGPLRPLVAHEPLEDVLAEDVGHQLGALHRVDRFVTGCSGSDSIPSASRCAGDSSKRLASASAGSS